MKLHACFLGPFFSVSPRNHPALGVHLKRHRSFSSSLPPFTPDFSILILRLFSWRCSFLLSTSSSCRRSQFEPFESAVQVGFSRRLIHRIQIQPLSILLPPLLLLLLLLLFFPFLFFLIFISLFFLPSFFSIYSMRSFLFCWFNSL